MLRGCDKKSRRSVHGSSAVLGITRVGHNPYVALTSTMVEPLFERYGPDLPAKAVSREIGGADLPTPTLAQ